LISTGFKSWQIFISTRSAIVGRAEHNWCECTNCENTNASDAF